MCGECVGVLSAFCVAAYPPFKTPGSNHDNFRARAQILRDGVAGRRQVRDDEDGDDD